MEEESVFTGRTFGIITDAKEWYFMECSLDDQDRIRFKLSKPVTAVYDSKNMGITLKESSGIFHGVAGLDVADEDIALGIFDVILDLGTAVCLGTLDGCTNPRGVFGPPTLV
ncbi:uncharacterized protein OCT59_023998 [Rhizophagus irregularis]|uniref:uncharacterized protein n=1 Tax=Rhizophagus irregularis TaxID=588596 RepID=UPI003327F07A|nr:hypothetical protein OCT59_023998 [Rhizophagus irregularis]